LNAANKPRVMRIKQATAIRCRLLAASLDFTTDSLEAHQLMLSGLH
jgi:hypothetical protein